MTDQRRTSSTSRQQKYTKYTSGDGSTREQASPAAAPPATPLGALAAAPPPRRRRSGAGGRIAAAAVGIAAMLGLVANMEVADGRAEAAKPAKSPALTSQRNAKGVRQGTGVAPGRVAATKVKRPIVLTPHAVVHTVSAPSSGGSGGGYAYSAPAPAAAPVASSGGS